MATTIPTGAKKIVTTNKNTYFTANNITIGTAAPTATTEGTYVKGDIIINSAPSASAIGWICTKEGSPGTWKAIKSGVDVTSMAWNSITGKPATFTPTLGVTSSTAFRGDYGNTAYQHSQAAHAPSNAQKNSDITKAEIEAKLTGAVTSHNHNGSYYTKTEVDNSLAGKSDTDHAHAWGEITGKPATFTPTLGTTSSTAFRGDQGKAAYDHSQAAHAPSNAQKNSDITKAEIEAKLTGTITSHNHNSSYHTKTEVNNMVSDLQTAINGVTGKLPVTIYKDDDGDIWYV